MIKIPATPEGIPAVRAAIAAGLNVNITLIFSLERYRAVIQAYLAGLEERLTAGLEVRQIASVASFFVSRMDVKVDGLLEAIRSSEANDLCGKAAIAYTKLAYAEFVQVFRGEGFARRSGGCACLICPWRATPREVATSVPGTPISCRYTAPGPVAWELYRYPMPVKVS